MSRSVRPDYETMRERQARAQESIVTAPDRADAYEAADQHAHGFGATREPLDTAREARW